MAAGEWGGTEGDYVVIRDLMLVEAFTALFDLAWSAALPVPDAASTSESDRRLLALLARGLQGRGDRALPRLGRAHGAAPGGRADGRARGRHPLPARGSPPTAGPARGEAPSRR